MADAAGHPAVHGRGSGVRGPCHHRALPEGTALSKMHTVTSLHRSPNTLPCSSGKRAGALDGIRHSGHIRSCHRCAHIHGHGTGGGGVDSVKELRGGLAAAAKDCGHAGDGVQVQAPLLTLFSCQSLLFWICSPAVQNAQVHRAICCSSGRTSFNVNVQGTAAETSCWRVQGVPDGRGKLDRDEQGCSGGVHASAAG